MAISGTAEMERPSMDWLYREVGTGDAPERVSVKLRAIPYFLWANRGRGPMTVWLRRE